MLSDKQVGEIWQHYHCRKYKADSADHFDNIIGLCLKLIEERAREHKREAPGVNAEEHCACDDFSIPYTDYLKAKEGK